MELQKNWWDLEKDPHKRVFETAGNIRRNQTAQEDLDERHFRLYSGLPLYSAFTFNLTFDTLDAKFTMNIVQAATNTLVSKIAKNKVRPSFLTDDGDWGMQQQAKKLSKYVYGQFYKSKVYEESKKALRDALIFGDGFIKHWHDAQGNIHLKKVFKPCLVVNQAEVMYGMEPKTIYEVRVVDKGTLKEKYPDFAVEIAEASITDIPFFIDSFESNHQLAVVVEAYRCAHVTYDKDGNKKGLQEERGKAILFEGDKVFHMASAFCNEGQKRIMISVQFSTNTNINWFNNILMRIKDVAYIGY